MCWAAVCYGFYKRKKRRKQMFVLQNSVPRRIFGLRGGKTQQPWNRYFHFSHSHKRSELLASPLLRTRGKVKLECIFADLFSLGFSCMCLTLSVYIFVHVCITEGPQISPERVQESLNASSTSFSLFFISSRICARFSSSPLSPLDILLHLSVNVCLSLLISPPHSPR